MAATDTFTGTTIVFGTSGFTCELLSASLPGASRAPINTSHAGTTVAHTKIPAKLIDWGQVEIEFNFDPDDEPPIDGAAETVTVTFPIPAGGTSGATLAGSMFMSNFTMTGTVEEKMTATATLEVSGDLTWTDST